MIGKSGLARSFFSPAARRSHRKGARLRRVCAARCTHRVFFTHLIGSIFISSDLFFTTAATEIEFDKNRTDKKVERDPMNAAARADLSRPAPSEKSCGPTV
jgi:hypothetical protein